MADKNCAKAVATATPTTPQSKASTKTKSRTTFTILAKIKKNNGVLLSPNALKILDTPL